MGERALAMRPVARDAPRDRNPFAQPVVSQFTGLLSLIEERDRLGREVRLIIRIRVGLQALLTDRRQLFLAVSPHLAEFVGGGLFRSEAAGLIVLHRLGQFSPPCPALRFK